MMDVYLVEDCANAPGRILAVFRNEEDAIAFAEQLPEDSCVERRTLQEGQPQVLGYNK